jgi:hypothetical protein
LNKETIASVPDQFRRDNVVVEFYVVRHERIDRMVFDGAVQMRKSIRDADPLLVRHAGGDAMDCGRAFGYVETIRFDHVLLPNNKFLGRSVIHFPRNLDDAT